MGFVGAQHEFHDTQFFREWSDRFVPSPERIQLFDTIIAGIAQSALPSRHIVELGIGPAYLAERVLQKLPEVTYEGVDFSQPMLDIAAERLAPYAGRVQFTQADLVAEDWGAKLCHPIGAIVSTWALHDLGSEANTTKVYQACRHLLAAGGVFFNGDFVKPDGTPHEYEPGRFLVSRHLDILRDVGFREAACLIYLEKEIEHPTAAQNYACFQALV